MKKLISIFILGLMAALGVFAQTFTLGQTSTSQALAAGANRIFLTSVTGIVGPSAGVPGTVLYVVNPGQAIGETMTVSSVTTSPAAAIVSRGGPQQGYAGSSGQGTQIAHLSGAMVLFGPPGQFYASNPTGSCVTASTYVTPWLNLATGEQWLCSTITKTWVPGWDNYRAPPQVTVLVASVAGATAVNSPLQHINGTNAITSFTMSAGWNGQGFCIIPDAAYTTVIGNNIGSTSTGVAHKTQCWTYDFTNSNFTSSY